MPNPASLWPASLSRPVILGGLVTFALAGCTSLPADYASTLSKRDPKWKSRQCVEARARAAAYEDNTIGFAAGALGGPYGLALAAAGKEHQEKQRRLLARELHLKCSRQPLPKALE